MKKKKIFELYTNNNKIKNVLDIFKSNQKSYLRTLEFLQLIGNFDDKTEIELYEISDTNENKEIKLWLSDIHDNIFILTPISTIKPNVNKIEKLTNDSQLIYDLSLAKKFKLTSDNITLLQSGIKYDFKYGRLITDNKNFYNLFLSNNTCYHLNVEFEEQCVSIEKLLSKLNKLESGPKFTDYIQIFDSILTEDMLKFTTINLSAFQNFEMIGNVTIDGNYKINKTLKKTK